jgi:hypothetical protein
MRMVICLQILTVFSTGGRITFLLLNVRIRQIEIHTAEPILHGPILLRLKLLLRSLKRINCQVVMKFRQN